jgi:hypothetical protein
VNLPVATTIGSQAFYGCSALTSVSLPEATTIGIYAFSGCALTSVSLPLATTIGEQAFSRSDSISLTIILGATAPTVGQNMFNNVSVAKTVTIRVPSGASGYDATWEAAFRGVGNTGTVGTENTNITLVIETISP